MSRKDKAATRRGLLSATPTPDSQKHSLRPWIRRDHQGPPLPHHLGRPPKPTDPPTLVEPRRQPNECRQHTNQTSAQSRAFSPSPPAGVVTIYSPRRPRQATPPRKLPRRTAFSPRGYGYRDRPVPQAFPNQPTGSVWAIGQQSRWPLRTHTSNHALARTRPSITNIEPVQHGLPNL